jgi:hypothetical protein
MEPGLAIVILNLNDNTVRLIYTELNMQRQEQSAISSVKLLQRRQGWGTQKKSGRAFPLSRSSLDGMRKSPQIEATTVGVKLETKPHLRLNHSSR